MTTAEKELSPRDKVTFDLALSRLTGPLNPPPRYDARIPIERQALLGPPSYDDVFSLTSTLNLNREFGLGLNADNKEWYLV